MIIPPCFRCRHFIEDDKGKPREYRCLAFPDEIPDEIVIWDKPHTEKVKGQVGDYVFDEVLPKSRKNE